MHVSIDAQILIWGIKKQATANRAHMIARASAFFERCRNDRTKLILPAQALAEYLVGFDDATRNRSIVMLERTFIIAPFDAKAASVAASLQRDRDLLRDIGEEYGLRKQTIKADINVLASAIASGSTRLISEDAEMVKLAQGRIIVDLLPTIQRQTDMFAADDGKPKDAPNKLGRAIELE